MRDRVEQHDLSLTPSLGLGEYGVWVTAQKAVDLTGGRTAFDQAAQLNAEVTDELSDEFTLEADRDVHAYGDPGSAEGRTVAARRFLERSDDGADGLITTHRISVSTLGEGRDRPAYRQVVVEARLPKPLRRLLGSMSVVAVQTSPVEKMGQLHTSSESMTDRVLARANPHATFRESVQASADLLEAGSIDRQDVRDAKRYRRDHNGRRYGLFLARDERATPEQLIRPWGMAFLAPIVARAAIREIRGIVDAAPKS